MRCSEWLAEETDGGSVLLGSLDHIKYLLCFVLFFSCSIDQGAGAEGAGWG